MDIIYNIISHDKDSRNWNFKQSTFVCKKIGDESVFQEWKNFPMFLFIPFWALQIPWLSRNFPWTIKVFHKLRSILILACFRVCFNRTKFNTHTLVSTKMCGPCHPHPLFALFNYLSPSYIILALTSAVTNLPNITLIFHHFPGL